MKTKIITSILLGVLVMGIVSAGLLDYFGKITGSVEVEGPVFYAVSISGDEQLSINEFIGSNTYRQINDIEQEIFWGEELSETMDFYRPKLTLFVKANLTEGIEPKDLRLQFDYVDEEGNVKDICYSEVSVSKGEYEVLSGECEAENELIGVTKFIYRLTGKGDIGVTYKIKIDGETKVKMDKAQ